MCVVEIEVNVAVKFLGVERGSVKFKSWEILKEFKHLNLTSIISIYELHNNNLDFNSCCLIVL